MKDAVKVKSTPRRLRKACQAKCLSDPDHLCSISHVRVPAHCRLKRNKKKRTKKLKPSALETPTYVQTGNDPSLLLLPAQFDGGTMLKGKSL